MEKLICPTCHNEMYIALDEWGSTPWHLHCDNCHINIGMKNINDVEKYIERRVENET